LGHFVVEVRIRKNETLSRRRGAKLVETVWVSEVVWTAGLRRERPLLCQQTLRGKLLKIGGGTNRKNCPGAKQKVGSIRTRETKVSTRNWTEIFKVKCSAQKKILQRGAGT